MPTSITWTGAGGLFTIAGKLIRLSNLFEMAEIGIPATPSDMGYYVHGDLFLMAYNELLDTLKYDRDAKTTLYNQENAIRAFLQNSKQSVANLMQVALAGSMVDVEDLASDDLTTLLNYLVEAMLIDAKTVDGNTITVTGPTADAGNQGNMTLVTSKYYHNVAGADASSWQNGLIRTNDIRITCTDITSSGAERFSVKGNKIEGGPAHPNWERMGYVGDITMISSVGNTLLANGGFESLAPGSSAFSNWAIATGTWNTHLGQENATIYRGSYSLKLLGNAKITQTFSALLPNTKYLITARTRKTVGADGTLDIGFATAGMKIALVAGDLSDAAWQTKSAFFNTGDDPSDLTFLIERAASAAGTYYVDEVTFTEVPLFFEGLGIGLLVGTTDPALGDFFDGSVVNNKEGTIQTFFSRYFRTLLPGNVAGGENILDTLAE